MKRNRVLLELIQVSTDKAHWIKFFGGVNGDVLPDFAPSSSIYTDTSMALECHEVTFTQKKLY